MILNGDDSSATSCIIKSTWDGLVIIIPNNKYRIDIYLRLLPLQRPLLSLLGCLISGLNTLSFLLTR